MCFAAVCKIGAEILSSGQKKRGRTGFPIRPLAVVDDLTGYSLRPYPIEATFFSSMLVPIQTCYRSPMKVLIRLRKSADKSKRYTMPRSYLRSDVTRTHDVNRDMVIHC